MAEIVFAIPILRQKEERERKLMDEVGGARRDEYVAALKDCGIKRQAIWHQQVPDGTTLAIVYTEATDPDALRRFTEFDAEINRWFAEQIREGYGRYVLGPVLPVELINDFRV
jgi:hypothetical protein